MGTILVVGGGYAGFYTAWRLEKKLRDGEARITVVDPRPYMTYQPFLPEVLAGSVEARHAAVSLRRHLRRTRLVAGTVTAIDHAYRTVTVHPAEGPDFELSYDIIVVTAGAVTRSHTDLPVDQRGLLVVRADLRVGTDAGPVPDAWGAGDDAVVPDLAAGRPGAATVMNAQHAVRQGNCWRTTSSPRCAGESPGRTCTTVSERSRRWASAGVSSSSGVW